MKTYLLNDLITSVNLKCIKGFWILGFPESHVVEMHLSLNDALQSITDHAIPPQFNTSYDPKYEEIENYIRNGEFPF